MLGEVESQAVEALDLPGVFRTRSHSYVRAIQAGCSQDDDCLSVFSMSGPQGSIKAGAGECECMCVVRFRRVHTSTEACLHIFTHSAHKMFYFFFFRHLITVISQQLFSPAFVYIIVHALCTLSSCSVLFLHHTTLITLPCVMSGSVIGTGTHTIIAIALSPELLPSVCVSYLPFSLHVIFGLNVFVHLNMCV